MDDELLQRAKVSIAREHGLSERDAHRLVGGRCASCRSCSGAIGGSSSSSTWPERLV
jgi:hypothetical protein